MAKYSNNSKLLEQIFCHADEIGEKVAVIAKDDQVTYSLLRTRIRQAATFLTKQGIGPHSRFILSAQKDVKFVYLYFGAHLVGATVVIVDAESNEDRLSYIEKVTWPVLSIGYGAHCCPSISLDDIDFFNMTEWNSALRDNVYKDDTSEIIFTTGTTGDPKGVCLSYENVYSSACNINSFIGNTKEDIEVLGLPICHSFGLGRIRCNLQLGATIILLGNFANMRLFLKTIEEYHVTGFGVVPAAWQYIRKISGTRIAKYADQIRYIEIGSASMPLSVKEELLRLFPSTRICMHYGLTEASRSTFQEFHDLEHLSSIGRPTSNSIEVAIFNSEGVRLGFDEEGELCVKGNMVTKSYLLSEDNKNAYWGEFFRTGDRGCQAKDGYFYLVGREKEMINVGGKKVSPIEVEDAICSLGVSDCICIGIPDKQGVMGELVKAYILEGGTSLSFEEISQQLSSKLELYKRPSEYEWIKEIPVTSSGKKRRVNFMNNKS